MFLRKISMIVLAAAALLVGAACAPAAPPSPTAAPAKPAATSAPAKPTQAPAAKPAEAKPAEPTPVASPAAKAEAKPAASPAAKSAEAKPAASPVAKVDTRAIEQFYSGKTVRIIVGTAPGGGYDTYSRLIGRHLGKHIPGKPNVIVENMPGAGMILAANHVYNAAPKDGTVIGNFVVTVAFEQLLGNPAIQFDATKFSYLGIPTSDVPVCLARGASGVKSLADVIGPSAKQLTFGALGPGSSTWAESAVLRDALGANLKIVQGYSGTAPILLAVEQGEVDGLCGNSWESVRSSQLEKVQKGDLVVVSQNLLQRSKKLPDVVAAGELAKTTEARDLIYYGIVLQGELHREYALPPGVPETRVQALRTALADTVADKEFLADAERSRLDIEPVGWEVATKRVQDLLSVPPAIKAKLEKIWKGQ